MLTRVIDLSVRHRTFLFFLIAGAVMIAFIALHRVKLDALPDLSDPQVILEVRWERPPEILEDQVVYPLTTRLIGAPRVKAVRSLSDFGYSFIYILFEDGTDLYWARSRVLEYLSGILPSLPRDVKVRLGPDATGLGWVLQYALVDESGTLPLHEIRSFHDFTLRYALQALPGVAEVAPFGGYTRELQVEVDPLRLQYYGLTLEDLARAVAGSSQESGARLIELGEAETMIRVRGYARSLTDLEDTVVAMRPGGSPITVGMVGKVSLVPALRRNAGDLNGEGEVVGAIVVMRAGENAYEVIARVKEKLKELERSFPPGLKVKITYDRSDLIRRALGTITHELVLEMIVVTLVILLSLGHFPSAVIPILTIPLAVLLSFIPLYLFGITVNLLSLGGIAISIGVLVDGAIIVVENAYNRTSEWLSGRYPAGSMMEVKIRSAKEVAPAIFFALLIIAVSFLPVFTLVAEEGRLFRPMAYSKTFAMIIASLLAVTFTPALMTLFTRSEPFEFSPRFLRGLANLLFVGKYTPEVDHPLFGPLTRIYEKILRWILKRAPFVVVASGLLTLTSIPLYLTLGKEFMPPLYEGTLLFMPTTLPGISIEEARRVMTLQDRILARFPEVLLVHGKVGRAETSTDPSPLSMWETIVVLKDEKEWRKVDRWYSDLPSIVHPLFRPFLPDHLTPQELIRELDQEVRIPGVVNSWTMPIRNRIDMLTTGIRTPVGIKVYGDDPVVLEAIGRKIEGILTRVPGTRSVFSERTQEGYYLEIVPIREKLLRYGLTIADLQRILSLAYGGEELVSWISGRERYPISIRLPRGFREDPHRLETLPVPLPGGGTVFLKELADLRLALGPAMIRSENGFKVLYTFVDPGEEPVGSYVERAKGIVEKELSLPPGYFLEWSGQYQNILRIRESLKAVVPLVLLLILILLYLHSRSLALSLIVLLAVPFSLTGAFLLLHLLDYHVSTAVWIGIIALMGLDAETGIVMLLYLELAYRDRKEKGPLGKEELFEAIVDGAARRLRPKAMTVGVALLGLLPLLLGTGIGADLMKRIAAPMIGGVISSFVMELFVYPAIYKIYREIRRE